MNEYKYLAYLNTEEVAVLPSGNEPASQPLRRGFGSTDAGKLVIFDYIH